MRFLIKNVNLLKIFSHINIYFICVGLRRYVMDRNNHKAKGILLDLFKASEAIVDIYNEIGSESGVHRLFDTPFRNEPVNRITNTSEVIDIQEWKARRNLKD